MATELHNAQTTSRYITALLMLLSLSTVDAQAGIYHCIEDGITTYSGSPCGNQTKEMDLRVDAPAQRSRGRSNYEGMDGIINSIVEERHRAHIRRLIRDKKEQINQLKRRRNNEIASLQDQQRYARNNTAGAAWYASLVAEMRMVSESTQAEITSLRSQISELQQQLQPVR